MIKLCKLHGVPWSLENPKTSRAWLTPPLKNLIQQHNFEEAHFCQYKMPWKKATSFLHSMPSFDFRKCAAHDGVCTATGKRHIILQGKDGKGVFLTKKAQPYPLSLCSDIAGHILKQLK